MVYKLAWVVGLMNFQLRLLGGSFEYLSIGGIWVGSLAVSKLHDNILVVFGIIVNSIIGELWTGIFDELFTLHR